MKKCVSICKLHTILEVAPSKKIRCLCEKTLSIQARFSVKNRAKIGAESDSKWQRQEKPTKTASGAVSGRTFSSPDSKKSQNRGLRLPKILLKTLQDGPFWGGSQNDLPKIVLKTLQDGPFWGGSQKTEGVGWPRDAYFGVGCKKWKASGGLETPRNAIFDCPPLPHAPKIPLKTLKTVQFGVGRRCHSPCHDFHVHGRRQRRRTCDFGGSFHRGGRGGINPSPGTGDKGFVCLVSYSWGSTRPEA